MSDATGMSVDFVVNQYHAQQSISPEMTPAQFFRENASISEEHFGVPVVLADIQTRIGNELPLKLATYFDEVNGLLQHRDAWKILDLAEPWMIENEGPDWRQEWDQRLGGGKRERAHSVTDASPVKQVDLSKIKPGDRILDFEIRDLVGRGTYGIVYRACNLALGRDVALKISGRTGNEGRALARLDHPNVVNVYGEYLVDNKRILEMQFIRGKSLEDWVIDRTSGGEPGKEAYLQWARQGAAEKALSENIATVNPNGQSIGERPSETLSRQPSGSAGTLPNHVQTDVQVAVWITSRLAAALQHSHSRGILHQDVKPANVLIDAQGDPKLTDFNVALISGYQDHDGVGGTINYMSPEQLKAYCTGDAKAIHAVDLRSDIYSLAILMLELLGGQKNWGKVKSSLPDPMARQLLAVRLRSTPPNTSKLQGVSQSLAAIIDKALQPNPDDRYQSAADFETDLNLWLTGRDNEFAENPSLVERVSRYIRRNRALIGALASMLLIALVGLMGWRQMELNQLASCQQLLQECEDSADQRLGSVAAEKLGAANVRLNQIWLTRFTNANEVERTRVHAKRCAELVQRLELFRFSALFGQASLLSMHGGADNPAGGLTKFQGSDLIEDGLRAYGVLNDENWFCRAPFSNLAPDLQEAVAENVTELMLVSMIHSSRARQPGSQEWNRVFSRLPPDHRSLPVFKTLKSGGSFPIWQEGDENHDEFLAYLRGVWATSLGKDEQAFNWYESALSNRDPKKGERFWLRYRLALTCQRLGKYQESLLHYAVCLGMRPDFAWIPFNMALVNVKLGQSQPAVKQLERAIELDPKLSAAYLALGAIQIDRSDYRGAIKTYDQAIEAGAGSTEIIRKREWAVAELKR